MNTKQHTLKGPVTVSGTGLHTGRPVTMTFLPAPVHHGFKFQRIDMPGQPIIEADADLVVETSRGTVLEKDGARVHTVEHALAALVGMQVDNTLIQLDNEEVPIMDGSSLPFVEAIERVGLEEQNALRNFFEVTEAITYREDERDTDIAALPLDDYRLTVMVDYNSPVLGSQHASIAHIGQFATQIAGCRTFCFLHEIEGMFKAGLIKGGDMSNAIVVVDRKVEKDELDYLAGLFKLPKVEVKEEGILNNLELRYKNEPARHKLLDMVGDLALAGRPIKAQILAARPGHSTNVAFAKKLKRLMKEEEKRKAPVYDPSKPPLMDVNQIYKMLPHEYPFRLLDRIFHLDESSVYGVKNVTINEPFFVGHFPGNPVMPGVLQIEAMVQTGGILVLSTVPDPENYWTYFLSIDACRFRRMVMPGDTVVFKCELLAPIRRGIAKMQGQAFVNGNLVSEAVMSASIVRKDS